MPAEDRYEAGWAKCRKCGTRRPHKALMNADDVCVDRDWCDRTHEHRIISDFLMRDLTEWLRARGWERVSASGENAEGTR